MADISPVAATALAGFGAVSPLRALVSSPLVGLDSGLGGGLGSGLSPFGGASVVVELSAVGQSLSAAANFQVSLAGFRPGSAASGVGRNFGDDFASLAAEAQFFVDAFNNLQGNLTSLRANFGSPTGQALTLPFVAALNRQATATVANGDSDFTRLAQIGISFQANGAGALPGATLSVDLEALQQAFAQDPAGSFSLLAESARSFESLANDFTTQTGGATLDLANLTRSIALTQTLSLFGSTLSNTGNGLQGLPGLLLLDALSRGGSGTNQQVAALSQFLLVSSLLE